MHDDLPWQSLTELSRRLAARETTSKEIVAALPRAHRGLDGKLHAFIDVYRDEARALADAADPSVRGLRSRAAARPADASRICATSTAAGTVGSKSWLGRKLRPHRHHGRAAARRGDDPAGQDAHGRVRVRRLGHQSADGRAVESLGLGDAPRGRRLVQRHRGRGRGGLARRASAATPAARCASRRRSTDWSDSSPPTAASAFTAPCRCPPRSIRSGRSPTRSTTRHCSPRDGGTRSARSRDARRAAR